MSAPVDATPAQSERTAEPSRRIRDAARDGLSVAAVSLGCSVALTAGCWVLIWWLG